MPPHNSYKTDYTGNDVDSVANDMSGQISPVPDTENNNTDDAASLPNDDAKSNEEDNHKSFDSHEIEGDGTAQETNITAGSDCQSNLSSIPVDSLNISSAYDAIIPSPDGMSDGEPDIVLRMHPYVSRNDENSNSDLQNNNAQCIHKILRMGCSLVRFLLLCPFIFAINTLLVLFLCLYISILLVAACFCPRVLERFFTAEHTYTEHQIQANLFRRELLQVVIRSQHQLVGVQSQDSGTLCDIESKSNAGSNAFEYTNTIITENVSDRLKNDFYEIQTAKKTLYFSKPLLPKETKAKETKYHARQKDEARIPKMTSKSCTRMSKQSSGSDIETGRITKLAEPSSIIDIGPNDDCDNNGAAGFDEDLYESGEGCDICMSSFVVGDVVAWSRNPKCSHVFHVQCITDWVSGTRRKKTCPCCRNDYIYEIDKRSRRSSKASAASFTPGFTATTLPAPATPGLTTTSQTSSTPGFALTSTYLEL